MSLIDLITGATGNKVAEDAERKFGISKGQMIGLAAVAVPLIIMYLKNKSEDADEAESLNKALDKDHNGSILNNPSQAMEKESEGNSILDHIFGSKKSTVESSLANQTGISMSKIGPLLATLAPLVMGYIGKQKQDSGVSSGGGLSDLLGGILGKASSDAKAEPSNPLNDILGGLLGGGNSSSGGNPLNDLLGGLMGGGSDKKSDEGGLGGLLGGIFGK
jgi:hypothetical protein